jgi:hypothetical protein
MIQPIPPRLKLHVFETVNRLNIDHRTSNIEPPILMALRFIYFKTSQSQNFEWSIRSRTLPAAPVPARRMRRVLINIFLN